jgi:hypothetical protein
MYSNPCFFQPTDSGKIGLQLPANDDGRWEGELGSSCGNTRPRGTHNAGLSKPICYLTTSKSREPPLGCLERGLKFFCGQSCGTLFPNILFPAGEHHKAWVSLFVCVRMKPATNDPAEVKREMEEGEDAVEAVADLEGTLCV